MAEQRGDREPVGQPADHRRLGKGADKADRRVGRFVIARGEIDECHRHQQSGGDEAHPAQAGRDGFTKAGDSAGKHTD